MDIKSALFIGPESGYDCIICVTHGSFLQALEWAYRVQGDYKGQRVEVKISTTTPEGKDLKPLLKAHRKGRGRWRMDFLSPECA